MLLGNLVFLWWAVPVWAADTQPLNVRAPSISDITPRDGNQLTGHPGRWTGDKPIVFRYRWSSCDASARCVPIAGAEQATFQVRSADVGRRLELKVTASNAFGTAAAVSSLTSPVDARGPSNEVLPTILGDPGYGEVLRATSGVWSGSPGMTYTYRWKRCDKSGAECGSISGATNRKYTVQLNDTLHSLRVAVTATNEGGSGGAWSEATAEVRAVAGTNVSKPTISDETPRHGNVLRGYVGRWTGTKPIAYAYQWMQCDAEARACSLIAGANASQFIVSPEFVGRRLRLRITAQNPRGNRSAESDASAVVGAKRPQNMVSPSISGDPRYGKTLRALPGKWDGTLPLDHSYRWKRCTRSGEDCRSIRDALAPTYTVQLNDAEHSLRVAVTTTNGGGAKTALSSATGEVPPVPAFNVRIPKISDETPRHGNVLRAYVGNWRGTKPISYVYHWVRCRASGDHCSLIENADSAQLVVTADLVGSRLRARVFAENAAGTTVMDSHATQTVQAGKPKNTKIPQMTGIARHGAQLITTLGEWVGTRPMRHTIQWRRCNALGEACAPISGASEVTYRPTPDDVMRRLRASVSFLNVAGRTTAYSEPSPPIAANRPVRIERPRITGPHRIGLAMTASPGVWEGTPPIFTRFQWLQCDERGSSCAPIPGANSSVYRVTDSDEGKRVRVQITASNPGGTTEWLSWSSGIVESLGRTLFSDSFDIGTQSASSPATAHARQPSYQTMSSDWEVTNGSVWLRSGVAWVSQSYAVDKGQGGNEFLLFRAHTGSVFGDIAVSFRLRTLALSDAETKSSENWDGVHVLLRRVDQTKLYAVSVNRRDHTLQIKKKCAGGPTNGGTYVRLSSPRPAAVPVPWGQWQNVLLVVRNQLDGAVLIDAMIDGVLVERVMDTGVGCAPITVDGAVGIRGDRVEFELDDFDVRAL